MGLLMIGWVPLLVNGPAAGSGTKAAETMTRPPKATAANRTIPQNLICRRTK